MTEKRKQMRFTITTGRNVFEQIGFDEAEASELSKKSDLMTQIHEYIRRHDLTQVKAAQVLGVTQPRISALVNGKITVFSLDELVRMYEATGSRVRLVLEADQQREESVLAKFTNAGRSARGKKSRPVKRALGPPPLRG